MAENDMHAGKRRASRERMEKDLESVLSEREELRRELDRVKHELALVKEERYAAVIDARACDASRKEDILKTIQMAWKKTCKDFDSLDIAKIMVDDLRKHKCIAVEIYKTGGSTLKYIRGVSIDVLRVGSYTVCFYYC